MDGSDPDAKRPFWQRLFGWRRQPVFSEEELHELIQASEQPRISVVRKTATTSWRRR